ncbi:MAG: chemotaxis protein CheW [Bacteroidetes bacterium 4572_77]|nr:MAG: chemotaxis protein CheW [Bacteroidetes bacterium 4572_77]
MNKVETILKKRAEILKTPLAEASQPGKQIEGLEFLLSDEKYAINSIFVSEVIYINELTKLPCTPPFIMGLINVRGKVLSVIDIKMFFNIPSKGITNLNKVIIVKYNDIEIGILADDILGNFNIQLEELQTEVTTITEVDDSFIIGVTNSRVVVLDIKKLLLSDIIVVNEVV